MELLRSSTEELSVLVWWFSISVELLVRSARSPNEEPEGDDVIMMSVVLLEVDRTMSTGCDCVTWNGFKLELHQK